MTGCLNSNSPWSKPCTNFQVSKCSGKKNSSVLVQIKSFSSLGYIFIASACEKWIKEEKAQLSCLQYRYLVKQPFAAFIVTGLLGGGVKVLFWFVSCCFVPLCSCSSFFQSYGVFCVFRRFYLFTFCSVAFKLLLEERALNNANLQFRHLVWTCSSDLEISGCQFSLLQNK